MTETAAQPDAAPAPPGSNLGVWLLGAGETIIWACIYYIFAAMLLTWETAQGWSKVDLTLGFTVAVLASAVASPLAGRAIDGGFGRWALGGGALAGAIGLAALSQATDTSEFVAVWAWIGFAQAFCLYEPCFMVVTRAKGAAARPAITRITLCAGFASTICFPASAIILDFADWRETLLIFAGAAAAVAAPLLYWGAALLERAAGDAAKPAPKAENRAALRAALRKPAFWLIALAFPLMSINHGILINHVMPLMDEKGISPTTAILVASTFGPMQVAGRVVLMLLEKRVSSLVAIAVGFSGVFCASLMLLGAGYSAGFAFAFAGMQGAFYGITSILKPAITADFLGRVGFGAIAGWLALPALAGGAIAPHLGSLIWEVGGYDLVIPATAGLAALGVLCVLALAAVGRTRRP